MTNVSGPENSIYLWPLDNSAPGQPPETSAPGQLRRYLGRETWRRNPVASVRYELNGDKLMIRLVDAPSTAIGYLSGAHPPDLGDYLFIGFDGDDGAAWLTVIAMLNVGWHCAQHSQHIAIVRDLIGNRVWEEVLSLRGAAAGEHEIVIFPDEATQLVRRWGDLVVSRDQGRPSEKALDTELNRLFTEAMTPAMTQSRDGSTAERPAPPPDSRGYLPGAAKLWADAQAAAVSQPEVSLRSEGDSGRTAGRRFGRPEANGAGAVMARRSSTFLEGKPLKPLPYGLLARWADIWAARRDGNAEVPPLPDEEDRPDPADTHLGVTPYMEIRNRHFLDRAERERRRMLTEIEVPSRLRAKIHEQIIGAEERATEARKALDRLPSEPPDLERRNVLEQHAPESLIRARRLREYNAERIGLQRLEQEAMGQASGLRAEEADLAEQIAASKRLLGSRVRQLHHHALRRCGTYIRHIVHHHPDGSAVIPYLEMARPTLPGWCPSTDPDEDQAGGSDEP